MSHQSWRIAEVFGSPHLPVQVHPKHVTGSCSLTSAAREKDVEWFWDKAHNQAFTSLKAAITDAPVLKFFDQKEPVTLSVDASSKGIGAVILYNDRPVAYASKALTKSQQNYHQIEKEMLAIMFGCERFQDYLYGQSMVTVEFDHKPLKAILKKPIHQAPLRFQKVVLRVKPYPLKVKYTPGSQLFIAHTLSRAHLPIDPSDQQDEFEINILESSQVSEPMLYKLTEETKKDPGLKKLHSRVVMEGWPQIKIETPLQIKPYITGLTETR